MPLSTKQLKQHIKQHGITKARIGNNFCYIPKGTELYFNIFVNDITSCDWEVDWKNKEFGYDFKTNFLWYDYKGTFEIVEKECEASPYCKCEDCQKEAENEYPADR